MASKHLLIVTGLLICIAVPLTVSYTDDERFASFWNNKGKQALFTATQLQLNVHQAKNVILFLGDGMGIPTVTAARILKGQMAGHTGEETSLVMDTFPYVALSKTYNVDNQMPDSAATATAYLCGVKANYGTIGVSAATPRGNCPASHDHKVFSVLRRAKEAGKSVGIVTTTRVQHASPAANYAHSADRDWYSDAELSKEAANEGCIDIASQLVQNVEIDVILGGGRVYMFPENTVDQEYPSIKGSRKDGRNLVSEWLNEKKNANYVENKSDFDRINPERTDFLMGLFEPKDCQYELDRNKETDPSLTEMVDKAIRILNKNPKGFFLFVEDNGRIDHAHHDGNAKRAIHDAVEFDNAIGKAAELTNELDTLTVITADHSHVFTFGGYSPRGNPVFGVSSSNGTDGKRFTTALYGNGPGYPGGIRPDLNATASSSDDYIQQAAVPLPYETHSIEDVAIFAKGPMSHLFHSVQEQSYIAHVMAYAACLEPYQDCTLTPSSAGSVYPSLLLLLIGLFPLTLSTL